jgi:SIR2-like domain
MSIEGAHLPAAIPDDLAGLVAERRVIPFVGAGFSAALDLPDWSQLLASLAEETEGSLPYEELTEYVNDDFLQIAEYLYLKSDGRIGPLRHVIEKSLAATRDPITSSAHVELANLGASQIYTTNYDSLIEDTFRALRIPANVISLPKDVALADSEKTQIVKYHGDLRHENTLVLTESAYYRRLDFESPMDLKFRSDILGRAVLFMGYSFRDINIRIIWFKLMQMMKDIPSADRRQSYIVRVEPNPVLEELYRAVDLKTIVLDPDHKAKSPTDRTEMLGEFLYRLGRRAVPKSLIPGKSEAMIVSSGLINKADGFLSRQSSLHSGFFTRTAGSDDNIKELFKRRLPAQLEEPFGSLLPNLLGLETSFLTQYLDKIIEWSYIFGPSAELTRLVGLAMCNSHTRAPFLRRKQTDWDLLWAESLTDEGAQRIIKRLVDEIEYSLEPNADEDIAYAADIVKRILSGQLYSGNSQKVLARAKEVVTKAATIYPAIKSYDPGPQGPPKPQAILAQVTDRYQELVDQGVIVEEDDEEATEQDYGLLSEPPF